jgi:hypothetical protein
MKFCIEREGAGLSVRIDDVAGEEQAVVEAIRRCRQSAWACPSGECMNIDSISECAEAGSVVLNLAARPGGELEPAGIELCLRYMLKAFSPERP